MNGKRIQMVDDRDTIPCAMLMYAKEVRVPLHGDEVFRREESLQRLLGQGLNQNGVFASI